MFEIPTLICSNCELAAGKFGTTMCKSCHAKIRYEPAHGHPEARFLKSWQTMKFGFWALTGLVILVVLISLLNFGENGDLALIIVVPALLLVVILGFQWFRVFIAKKYLERNAVHFG